MKTLKQMIIPLLLSTVFILTSATQAGKEKERIQKSTVVLQDFGKMKENIPAQLLRQAEGIVIIPKMINAGLVIGGKRGSGVAMVKRSDGSWSNPVFVILTGG